MQFAAHPLPNRVLAFLRKPCGDRSPLLIACKLTPIPRLNSVVGMPRGGRWRKLANNDAEFEAAAAWAI